MTKLSDLGATDFCDLFDKHNRSENFTEDARHELFDYYKQFGPDCEIDIVGICCDWGEYTVETLNDYFGKFDAPEVENPSLDDWTEHLSRNYSVIAVDDDSILVSS